MGELRRAFCGPRPTAFRKGGRENVDVGGKKVDLADTVDAEDGWWDRRAVLLGYDTAGGCMRLDSKEAAAV